MTQDDRTRPQMTTGAMISTLCFVGAALALADAATRTEGLRAVGLWTTAVAAAAGAARYQIARLIDWLTGSE